MKRVIKVPVSKAEIMVRIEDVTIMKGVHSILIKVRDYVFWKGKLGESDFVLRPLPIWIAPYSHRNAFAPKIKGKISEKENACCEMEIEITNTADTLLFCFMFALMPLMMWWLAGLRIIVTFLLFCVLEIAIIWYSNYVVRKSYELFIKTVCEETKE